MSGYGAGLDIKRSDYLVVDDRLSAGNVKGDQAGHGSEDRPKMLPVGKEDIAGKCVNFLLCLQKADHFDKL